MFPLFAWDVEHDELAQLVGENLPPEIKSFFKFEDFGTLIEYCHFPDMTDWEPRRWHDLDDIEAIVGKRDRDVIESREFFGYWMHTEDGKATFMTLLARAFARGESHNAAFYLSALTHPVGDESALNHPPLLNFIKYCGRTLRDRGWAVKGISLRSLKPGALSVAETPVVIAAFGNDAPAREQADALIAFRKAGGRLIYISGQFCTASHDRIASGRPLVLGNGDPLDISGMADILADRTCEEVPASPGWGREGACPDWRKMNLVIGGRRFPLRHDANGDGWSKAACAQEVRLASGVEPVAFLDNGKTKFCVAARRGKVTWLPVYMLSPFLFSEDKSLDFGALRLDSFAEQILMREIAAP